MRHAVLDLGSNSYHVLVADLHGRSVCPVLREREMLHLGRVVAQHGAVPEADAGRAEATVRHLAELARRSGAEEVLAVATAALRDAANGAEVLTRLSDAAGVAVEILPGLEEARLAYLGVRAALAVRAEPVLVLDLGGGSLELAIGVGQRVVWSASVPLGASRLSARVPSDPPQERQLAAVRAEVDAHLDPLVDVVRAHAPGTTVAVGGTVRALGRIAAAGHAVWLPATVNQLELATDRLAALERQLVRVDLQERREVPGMKDRRADHVHVAAVVLARVLERLGAARVTVCDWGLREGLLLDRHAVSAPPTAQELRQDEVARLRRAFGPHDPHPDHVADLADQLFAGTRQLHELDDADRELLGLAARLHAIGESIALRRQQVHGAYLIENAELRGFSPADTAMLAALVRFHRSRGIDASFPPFAALDAAHRRRTEQLLGLLQVADGLDRAHDQAVTAVEVATVPGRVELTLRGGRLHSTDAEVARRTRWFARVFDVDVTMNDVVDAEQRASPELAT